MFKRARISLLVALVIATMGFTGLLDVSIARPVFYLLMAFAALSATLGFFAADDQPHARLGKATLEKP